MRDDSLLTELLSAENETEVVAALDKRKLLNSPDRWRYLGEMPNNQSIVHAQQSSPTAALIEKYTNGVDAVLLRQCKSQGIDPRSPTAPKSMSLAIEKYFGDFSDRTSTSEGYSSEQLREFAESSLVLYATGSKERPSLSFFDAGEGQLPENFPTTFCSLIHGTAGGSYKGAIPFVQGRFNMGSSGVLPFCSEKYKLQLVVSRVPNEVVGSTDHEWGYTLFCFFKSSKDPSWHYLVGSDGAILSGGQKPIGLVPPANVRSGTLSEPRGRLVDCGTLIKMYDFKAPRSNICGELFKKTEEFLLLPPLPLRIVECRAAYSAKVMRVTVWDRLSAWSKDKLEPGFEEGASISIKLSTGETVPVDVRVFKASKFKPGFEDDSFQTGVRALINGQSHAKRDAQFFRTKAVDKEHIAGSMLVLLDCTELGQDTRNALFMSNRETFREDPLLTELFKTLQKELHDHEGLIELNQRRYAEKIADSIDDEDGIKALEDLLANDPTLADLFGSAVKGRVAAKTAVDSGTVKITGDPQPFLGKEFPSYFKRADGSITVDVIIPQGSVMGVAFRTDVENSYFARRKHRGTCEFGTDFKPSFHLFDGKLTFKCAPDKAAAVGSSFAAKIRITDNKGSGPFPIEIRIVIGPKVEPKLPSDRESAIRKPKVDSVPSRPDISEVKRGPESRPLEIERVPDSDKMKLLLNTDSQLLENAISSRPKEEKPAVEFIFKYGLALIALSLIDAAKKTEEWKADQAAIQTQIERMVAGAAKVIVPLCLSLPKKIPTDRKT